MFALSRLSQTVIGAVLVALLVITRGHHLPEIKHLLPSASWAVFFLAGIYLRPAWALAGLLGLAAFVDYAAISRGGVSGFCVSPAYIALLPAYGLLWYAGRWYAGRHRFETATLLPLALTVFFATAACELITSGSFYLYSGYFTDSTLQEFAGRFIAYFPSSLRAMAFWIGTSALIHFVAVTRPLYGGTSRT